jgi:hypothetical protein
MSAAKFDISYAAAAQIAMLPRNEKAELTRLFSSDQINQPSTTKATGDGRFVSRIGNKRVLWRRSSKERAEILSVVDKSFAKSG